MADVSFGYAAGTPVLRDVSLHLAPGRVLGRPLRRLDHAFARLQFLLNQLLEAPGVIVRELFFIQLAGVQFSHRLLDFADGALGRFPDLGKSDILR